MTVSGNDQTAKVENGETASAALTNTYTKQVGSLEITKTTEGADTPSDTIFTITGPNGYSKTVKYSEFKDGKYTLENLPLGEYTVTEDAASAQVKDYTLTVSGNGQTAKVEDWKTAAAALTNTYTQQTGSLEITKTTKGAATPDDTEFTITGPNGYSKTVKYSEFKDGKYTLEKLPVGEYKVTEDAASAEIKDYTLTVNGNGQTAKVEDGKTVAAAITNTYTQQTGSLEITKTTKGAVTPDDTEFTITGPNGYSQTVKYSEFKDGKYTLDNLPVGEYTVTEDAESAEIKNYTLSVNGNGTTAQVENGKTASAVITNTYTQQTGSLAITKTTNGATTPDDTEFTITGPNDYSQTVKYSEFKDGKYTLDNLPVGEYTVTEDAESAEIKNYTLSVNGNGTTAQVENGKTAEAVITNTYTHKSVIKHTTTTNNTTRTITKGGTTHTTAIKTGDNTNITAFAVLFAASVCMLIVLYLFKRKREN